MAHCVASCGPLVAVVSALLVAAAILVTTALNFTVYG